MNVGCPGEEEGRKVEFDDGVEGVVITLRTRAVQSNAGGFLWTSCMGRAGGNGASNSMLISAGA